MRIATFSAFDRSASLLSEQSTKLNDLQAQITSQKKVNKPSDDPAAAAEAERLRSQKAKLDADQRMIGQAKTMLQQADGSVSSATDELQNARELLLQASSTTLNASDRANLAEQLRGSMNNLLAIANQSNGAGGYVFGGAGATSQPFVLNGVVTYQAQSGQQTVATDASLATSQDGQQAFMSIPAAAGGSQSIFDAINTSISVLSDPTATPAQITDGTKVGIDGIDASIERLSQLRTRIGESLKVVDNQTNLSETSSINLQARLSDLVDLDYAKALTDFTATQTGYQAAMQTYASIAKMSLFQYL